MALPMIKLDQGIHVLHLFYKINREKWAELSPQTSAQIRQHIESLTEAYCAACHPRITCYTNIGGKADLVFWILAADLVKLSQIHRDLESGFPPGTLQLSYSYLSVTESSEYTPSDEDHEAMLVHGEKLIKGSDEFNSRLEEIKKKMAEYRHYRLYPEMPDWEVMCFYPMLKRRTQEDNWYSLDFPTRKKLMAGHAKVGRKYAGRVSQLITGSTGLDLWEWGVTLMAHQIDAIKEIVYEMRFDEVSAKYAEFGDFYINIRLSPEQIWEHLNL